MDIKDIKLEIDCRKHVILRATITGLDMVPGGRDNAFDDEYGLDLSDGSIIDYDNNKLCDDDEKTKLIRRAYASLPYHTSGENIPMFKMDFYFRQEQGKFDSSEMERLCLNSVKEGFKKLATFKASDLESPHIQEVKINVSNSLTESFDHIVEVSLTRRSARDDFAEQFATNIADHPQ